MIKRLVDERSAIVDARLGLKLAVRVWAVIGRSSVV
jgi:hypothetical protein